MKTFRFAVTRMIEETTWLDVQAKTHEAAQKAAEQIAEDAKNDEDLCDWEWQGCEDEVRCEGETQDEPHFIATGNGGYAEANAEREQPPRTGTRVLVFADALDGLDE